MPKDVLYSTVTNNTSNLLEINGIRGCKAHLSGSVSIWWTPWVGFISHHSRCPWLRYSPCAFCSWKKVRNRCSYGVADVFALLQHVLGWDESTWCWPAPTDCRWCPRRVDGGLGWVSRLDSHFYLQFHCIPHPGSFPLLFFSVWSSNKSSCKKIF